MYSRAHGFIILPGAAPVAALSLAYHYGSRGLPSVGRGFDFQMLLLLLVLCLGSQRNCT